jgi:hypothetical protein
MKNFLLFLFFLVVSFQVYAQDDTEVSIEDELITEESAISRFSGHLVLEGGNIKFYPTDCHVKASGQPELIFEEKEGKKMFKKLGKNKNRFDNVVVLGSMDNNKITVKKVKIPYQDPKKASGAPAVDTYVSAVFLVYKDWKQTIRDANYLTVQTVETNDPLLGVVTSNNYYDQDCKLLTSAELLELRPKALSSLGKSLDAISNLSKQQEVLDQLEVAAKVELEKLTGLQVLTANKNFLYAQVVEAGMFLEIPKLVANLNRTKDKLQQLKNE